MNHKRYKKDSPKSESLSESVSEIHRPLISVKSMRSMRLRSPKHKSQRLSSEFYIANIASFKMYNIDGKKVLIIGESHNDKVYACKDDIDSYDISEFIESIYDKNKSDILLEYDKQLKNLDTIGSINLRLAGKMFEHICVDRRPDFFDKLMVYFFDDPTKFRDDFGNDIRNYNHLFTIIHGLARSISSIIKKDNIENEEYINTPFKKLEDALVGTNIPNEYKKTGFDLKCAGLIYETIIISVRIFDSKILKKYINNVSNKKNIIFLVGEAHASEFYKILGNPIINEVSGNIVGKYNQNSCIKIKKSVIAELKKFND